MAAAAVTDKKLDPASEFHLIGAIQKQEQKLVTCSALSSEWKEALDEINRLYDVYAKLGETQCASNAPEQQP